MFPVTVKWPLFAVVYNVFYGHSMLKLHDTAILVILWIIINKAPRIKKWEWNGNYNYHNWSLHTL